MSEKLTVQEMEKKEDGWKEREERRIWMWNPAGFLFSHCIPSGYLIQDGSSPPVTHLCRWPHKHPEVCFVNSQVILNPIRWTMRLIKPLHTQKKIKWDKGPVQLLVWSTQQSVTIQQCSTDCTLHWPQGISWFPGQEWWINCLNVHKEYHSGRDTLGSR